MTALDLAFHGGMVLMIGLAAGLPFNMVILKNKSHDQIRAWRVAHSSLCMGGTAMIAFAAALPILKMPALWEKILIISFVASGYGFCFSMFLGASTGERGLTFFSGNAIYRLVYVGNFIGSAGSTIATACFIYGAWLVM
ncbi:MAG: hypothetical protein OEZ39_17490 [Gammaproteobacteria bacterium]|nr:hypothetical protein [Gammaproteobacteria bacterium]MDH5653658.1 hypothetical protein [Gammaproteobacteria bacterium]